MTLDERARAVVDGWHQKHAPSKSWRLFSAKDLEADIAAALREEQDRCEALARLYECGNASKIAAAIRSRA